MKKIFLIVMSLWFVIGCTQKKLPNKDVATKYFNARNAFEFKEIQVLISDSLTIVEGDYTMLYSQESFYEVFKWDSVFQTSYKIIDLQESEEQIVASISLSSIRNVFLKNDPLTCQFKLFIDSGIISKIESLDCDDANWEIWEERVNTLVNWVAEERPELNGFIHDMTMKGAKNYVQAIHFFELFEKEH